MAPSCSLESRGAAETLTKIMFRGSSNVLSPSKAISPSVRTVIAASIYPVPLCAHGIVKRHICLCVTQRLQDAVKPAHTLTTPRENVPFAFLRNERSCQKNMSTCRGSLSVQTEMPFFLPESRFSGWTFLHLQMEGRDTEKTAHQWKFLPGVHKCPNTPGMHQRDEHEFVTSRDEPRSRGGYYWLLFHLPLFLFHSK